VVADGQNRLHLSVPRGTNGHLRLIVFAQAKDGHILTVAERTLQREQTAPILSSLAIDRGSGKFGLQV
jgi:hypothetical protein